MSKNIRCPQCNGKGEVGTKKQNGVCFKCGGTKQINVSQRQYDIWKKKEDERNRNCDKCNKKQDLRLYRLNGNKCIRCEREMEV